MMKWNLSIHYTQKNSCNYCGHKGQIIGNYTYPTAIPLDSLRDVEKEIVVHEDKDKKLNVAVFDLRKNSKL